MKTFTILLWLTALLNLSVLGQGIRISSGATLNGGSATLTLPGNWNNSGTFTPGTSTVTFNGATGNQTIIKTGGETFYNFTVNKSSGDVQLLSDVSASGTVTVTSGDIDLKGNVLSLGTAGTLSESAGNTVKGTSGIITATRTLNAPSSENVAGMGAEITSAANLGSTSITRGHTVQTGNSTNSILRYFDITPTTNTGLNAAMVFRYDDSELNSLTESELILFKSTDTGTNWTQMGGTVNTTNNTVTLAGLNGFSRWTLGASSPLIVNTSDDLDDGICDATHCSLREAINTANNDPWPNRIYFDIPGSGPHTIQLLSPLPPIIAPVVIDGYSQTGADEATETETAALKIELDGTNAGDYASALTITAGNSTVRGLVINRFGDVGIHMDINGGNTIEGNYIGTDASGTLRLSNGQGIIANAPNNTIGGSSVGARNIISGNIYKGVWIDGIQSTGNSVIGNYIGTDVSGELPLGNDEYGVGIDGAADNTVAGNTISDNGGPGPTGSWPGVGITGNTASGNRIIGNLIGTDVSGEYGLGNSEQGVFIGDAPNNFIGGTESGERNVISGNGKAGVKIDGSSATGNLVQGNYIGTDYSGLSALSNHRAGVFILSSAYNIIGGTEAGAGNVISGNLRAGIYMGSGANNNTVQGNYIGLAANGSAPLGNGNAGVKAHPNAGIGNAFLYNKIHSNAGLGIDLLDDGVTPNDTLDSDTGPNNLQNFPVLSNAYSDVINTTVDIYINSTPETEFQLQLFKNDDCDPSGYGEGKIHLTNATITTDLDGNGMITGLVINAIPGDYITATATDPGNNTSEFSGAINVGVQFYQSIQNVGPRTTEILYSSIADNMTSATFSSSWPGSDVVMTLTTPSGRVIGRNTTDPDVEHENDPTFEKYIITNPEAGLWTIELFGADVPPEGEDVTVTIAGMPIIQILVTSIDIKPDDETNTINCTDKKALIPVAIITTEYFNALTVDHTKVTFGLTGIEATPQEIDTENGPMVRTEEDFDEDGDVDLILHFLTEETGIDLYNTQAFLFGETSDEEQIIGSDFILPLKYSPYLFLADNKIKVDKISPSFGKQHSNDKIDLRKGPTSYTGDVTAVGKIDIKKDITIDGDVFAGGELKLGNNVTITGTYEEYADVDPVDLPSFFFSSGGENIRVKKNKTKELLPGTYGKVEVENNGKVKLFTGEYFIEKLKSKKDAKLELHLLNGPITINVEKKVNFDKDVEIILLPTGEVNSQYVNINSLEDINVNNNSILYGSLNAPEGKIQLKQGVKLKGSISAEEIDVHKSCVLLHHTSPISLAKAGNLAAEEDDDVPNSFSLAQNYPNPFNPATIISYGIPVPSKVRLEVFNVLGQLVTILVNEQKEPGYHEAVFQVDGLASGIYIYRLIAGDPSSGSGQGFVETKKMILLK